MVKHLKIAEVKENPNNPRILKDDKFKKLVKSLKEFPEMANVRPLVLNKENIILGGNMQVGKKYPLKQLIGLLRNKTSL